MKTITLESGNKIVIGKSAQENFDVIDMASPDDLWFHLESLPSCHVVLIQTVTATEAEVLQAAQLCKENTKFRGMNSVYVSCLAIQHIQKTAVLGKVILKKKARRIKLTRTDQDEKQ